jgi:hypothetical protein
MIKFAVITAFGALFLFMGIFNLRARNYADGISLIEDMILKITKKEPLPISRTDIMWGKIQAWLLIIIGVVLFAIGLLGLKALFF